MPDPTPTPVPVPARPTLTGCLFPASILMVAAAVLAHGLIPHPQPKPAPVPPPVIVRPEPQAALEFPQPLRVVVEGLPAPAPAPVKPDVTESPAPTPAPASDPPLVAAYRKMRQAQPAALRAIGDQIRAGTIKDKVGLLQALSDTPKDFEQALDLACEDASDARGSITKPAQLADLFNKMAGVKP